MDQPYDIRASAPAIAAIPHNLSHTDLSYVEALAQSVPVVAPSTVLAAVLGLIYKLANNILLSIFVAYMVLGLAWLAVRRTRRPRLVSELRDAIDAVDIKFAGLRERPS